MPNPNVEQASAKLNCAAIAPKLTLQEAERGGVARIQLDISPGVPVLCFSFDNLENARSAMGAPEFLSSAIWKSLPLVGDQMIDALVDGFIRPQDLYHRTLTYNKTANHHLREAGVFSISPATYH